MENLDSIKELVKGKKVALVGNSGKVVGKNYPIDEFDVVVRINRAWDLPEAMKKDVGTKLDILCISGGERKNLESLVNSPFITVWMARKRREEIPEDFAEKISLYPIEWWYELYDELGSFPSTGCMAFDFLRRLIGENGTLTLYGFDFFQSNNWYNKKKLKHWFLELIGVEVVYHPHSGEKEEEFICNALPSKQFHLVKLS